MSSDGVIRVHKTTEKHTINYNPGQFIIWIEHSVAPWYSVLHECENPEPKTMKHRHDEAKDGGKGKHNKSLQIQTEKKRKKKKKTELSGSATWEFDFKLLAGPMWNVYQWVPRLLPSIEVAVRQ